MTIKQQGGIFGRNPTFNDVTVDGTLTQSSGTTNLVDVEASHIEIDTTTASSPIAQLALWSADQSEQAYLRLAHSLGTSKGSHQVITRNDFLGGVRFAGSTGTDFYDGASVEGKATQDYGASKGGTEILFKTTPNATQSLTRQMSLSQDGTLTVDNGDIVIGTSGKGINFSATSGTGTSELFNDYEEGIWTATLTGSTTDPSSAVTATAARYTKVGRTVHVMASFENVDTTGASGGIQITGLPYTSSASGRHMGSVLLYSIGTFTGSVVAHITQDDTKITVFESISNAAYQIVDHNAGSGRYMWISVTYDT